MSVVGNMELVLQEARCDLEEPDRDPPKQVLEWVERQAEQ